ncbi:hypothetical protein FGO68_gene15142 [Halteria grandinella]|uniref:Uncharacterized protein n=1 Tax=Halteria grandinella TaxID=5974 RepID=A0A8J8SZQ2_HALGN|nr:hypothetical protein FGO68_gene15142 [Halteria grandinella]
MQNVYINQMNLDQQLSKLNNSQKFPKNYLKHQGQDGLTQRKERKRQEAFDNPYTDVQISNRGGIKTARKQQNQGISYQLMTGIKQRPLVTEHSNHHLSEDFKDDLNSQNGIYSEKEQPHQALDQNNRGMLIDIFSSCDNSQLRETVYQQNKNNYLPACDYGEMRRSRSHNRASFTFL